MGPFDYSKPRSVRTFNPGAMNYGDFAKRNGAIGSDGRLAVFPDEATGFKAMGSLLDVYAKRGQNSVSSIIGGLPNKPNLAWAPRGVDNNSTDAYIKHVAMKLGVDPNAPLNPEHRQPLMQAMAGYESGLGHKGGGMLAPAGAAPGSFRAAQGEQPPVPTMGAAPMAGNGMLGTWTPDEVNARRRMAGGMIQEGMSTAPVQHWTQGLARVIGGLSGNMWMDQANQADRQGVADAGRIMQEALNNPDPKAGVGGMLGNPRTAQAGQQLATGMLSDQIRSQTPEGKLALEAKTFDLQNRRETAPLQQDLLRAQTKAAQAKDEPFEQTVRRREAEASRLGLLPGSPAFKAYALTGKMPREDQQPLSATDKKAILEADETVQAAQSAIIGLDKALSLSKQAYSGMGAGVMGTVFDKAVPWATPDATATTQLDQVVTSQALEQLKSLFGAAPTEGERKILLDIQGSVSQSREAREAIYKRAKEAAARRLEFNKQRAAALRNQTYYQDGSAPQTPQAAPNLDNDPLGIR